MDNVPHLKHVFWNTVKTLVSSWLRTRPSFCLEFGRLINLQYFFYSILSSNIDTLNTFLEYYYLLVNLGFHRLGFVFLVVDFISNVSETSMDL